MKQLIETQNQVEMELSDALATLEEAKRLLAQITSSQEPKNKEEALQFLKTVKYL